jgi:hypothetical protein
VIEWEEIIYQARMPELSVLPVGENRTMACSRVKLWVCLFFAIITLALLLPAGVISAADPVVNFPDTSLQAIIRENIKKPTGDIHQSDLENIYSLQASSENIGNLTGLEYCINLQSLWLDFNNINDISPLASLTKLDYLDLSSNQIKDVSPLASLTKLDDLDLSSNQINDISPLVSLTNLTSLYLDDNPLYLTAINTYIPRLKDRGVYVSFYPTVSFYPSDTGQTTSTSTAESPSSDQSLIPALSPLVWIFIGIGGILAVTLLIMLIFFVPQHLNRLKKFEITDVNETTAAARFRTFHNNTKGIAHNDIGLGVFCIVAGSFYVWLLGGLNIILIGIGLLLLAGGIWLKVTQNRGGLVLSIVLMLVFGAWIIGNAVFNVIALVNAVVNNTDISEFATINTVFSLVIWIPFWFSFIKKTIIDAIDHFKNYSLKTVPKPTDKALQTFDALKKTIIYANYKKETDSVRFTTNGFLLAWRGKLDRRYGLLLSKSGDDFRIIRPEDIDIWSSPDDGASQPADNNKNMNVALNEVVYNCSVDALSRSRLLAWKKGTLIN